MKIKDKRSFASGIIALVVLIACVAAYIAEGERRFLVSAVLALIWSGLSIYSSFHEKGTAEQMAQLLDERDRLVVLKSNDLTLKIMNYVLSGGTMVSMIIYVITESSIALAVGVTLLSVLLVMLAVVLGANAYCEKRN